MTTKRKASEDNKQEDFKNDVEVQQKEIAEKEMPQSTDALEPDIQKVCNHTSVVIPYSKKLAQGKELLYAIRSWQKYVRFGINMVIIGDHEDWFGEEITFIEHQCVSDNPQVDISEKLKLAIESPEVTESFIWTCDDIYLLNPISLAHIELPKVSGELSLSKYSGTFATSIEITALLLKNAHLPMLNYNTHTPVMFNKALLDNMYSRFPELKAGGYLIPTVYFNSLPIYVHPVQLNWKKDQLLLPIISQAPDESKILELLSGKVFLNNAESGYSQWLELFLERLFPEPSDFEE